MSIFIEPFSLLILFLFFSLFSLFNLFNHLLYSPFHIFLYLWFQRCQISCLLLFLVGNVHVLSVLFECTPPGIIFIMASMGAFACGSMSVVSVALSVFMMLLEVLVCFIQALVFTMLSSVFISLARVKGHEA